MRVRLRVKEVAKQKDVSQRQLSLRSGVDLNTVRRIFKNPNTVVTTVTLGKLAQVLDVDVSELIESVPDRLEANGSNEIIENFSDEPEADDSDET